MREGKQPLLYVNSRKGEGDRIYLPTEICNEASLPPDFTRDQYKMRQIQDYKISGPEKRMEKINKLITKFQNDPTFQQWGVKIDTRMTEIQGKKL